MGGTTDKPILANNELPAWAVKEYEGDVLDLIQWYRTHYLTANEIPENKRTEEAEAILSSRANEYALHRVKAMEEKHGRAFIYLLMDAKKKGWHRLLEQEYDTIQELIASMADSAEDEGKMGEYSDLAFIADTVLPIMEQSGISAEKVVALPLRKSKLRAAVPAMREILACPKCGVRRFDGTNCVNGHSIALGDGAEKIEKIVDMIGNDSVPVSQMQAHVAEVRGKIAEQAPQAVSAAIYLLGGKELIVIESENRATTMAIKSSLKHLTPEMEIRDMMGLVRLLAPMVGARVVEK